MSANGIPYDQNKFKAFGSYLGQDDALFEGSTPKELFTFAATLRTELNEKEIENKVNQMISLLGLQECQDMSVGGQYCSGMSGGEKKRTSIGYEIISNSKVMILDEPFSGLDSQNAIVVLRYLRKLTQVKNITVICSLHQPSSEMAHMCDQISCLSDGCQIYFGPPNNNLREYFNTMGVKIPKYCNPSDFLLKLSNEPEKFNIDAQTLIKSASKDISLKI